MQPFVCILLAAGLTAQMAAPARAMELDRIATLRVADDGAVRTAYAAGAGFLLSTAPRQSEIHLHRADWTSPLLQPVDAFPPTDTLRAIPAPGRPTAVAAHPAAPLAIALSSPRDARARGEVLLLDLRERSPGRLLRTQLVGFEPADLAISPDGRWAIVANQAGSHRRTPGSIGVLDLRTLTGWEINRLQELPYRELDGLDRLVGAAAGRLDPGRVAVEPGGRLAAVTLPVQHAVVWVDLRGETPQMAGILSLPAGSKPVAVSLLDQPDGSLLAAVAEKGSQRVSFYSVRLGDAEPEIRLLSRSDVRPWINPKRGRKRRDPVAVLLDRAQGRPVAWIGCARSDRVLLLDLSDQASPRLLARRAVTAPPRDLMRVETPTGARVVTASGDGTLDVLAIRPPR